MSKKYLQIFKNQFAAALEYRSNLVANLGLEILSMFSFLIFWIAVYRHENSVGGYTLKDSLLYYIAIPLIGYVTYAEVSSDLGDRIRNGFLSSQLLKPQKIWLVELTRSFANKLNNLIIISPLYICLFIYLLVDQHVAVSFGTVCLTIFIAICAYILHFIIDLTIAWLAFWLDDVWAFTHAKNIIFWTLGGLSFPFEFLSDGAQLLFNIFPFKFMYYVPVSYLLGKRTVKEYFFTDLIQIVLWLIFFIIVSIWLWKKGERDMKLSVIKNIKKYIRIYSIFLRFSLIRSTQYRISFFIELIIEIGYQFILILFYKVVYANVQSIAGWTYYEALLLSGFAIISTEILLGLVYIFNLDLPQKIKNGDLDLSLLMPMNSLFTNTLSMPYFTSILSIIPGIYLIIYAGAKLNMAFSLISIMTSSIIFIAGLIIGFCILTLFSSLSFIFINGTALPKIGETVISNYHSNPHSVYTGAIRIIFMYILPVTFLASIPASTIVHGINTSQLLLAIILAALFLFFTIVIWNRLIRLYSSASS